MKNTDKNRIQVNLVRSWLRDSKEQIEKNRWRWKKIEKPNETVNIVEKILEFNNQNQSGEALKILTSDQMLSRLAISLAQLKAENKFRKT